MRRKQRKSYFGPYACSLYFNHITAPRSMEGLKSEPISTARCPGLLNSSPSADRGQINGYNHMGI